MVRKNALLACQMLLGRNLDTEKKMVCRILRQYNRKPISAEDMKRLQEIAEDYRKVKNYVYVRYGGIGSVSKLYPGYTVQNEMTASGLRAELQMPSVYFYRAVYDALGDIKSQWTRTKAKITKLIGQNENLSEEEKHYLRFLLKTGNAFDAALNRLPMELPQDIQKKYRELASEVDVEKMHRYLSRQVRKYHVRNLSTEKADGFYITERAYRYGIEKNESSDSACSRQHGIYIATKENRKRIFVPLTDENAYDRQLYIKLIPGNNGIEIHIPVEIKAKRYKDYTKELGLSFGMQHMFTTHEGKIYGEQFGRLHHEFVSYMRTAAASYRRERQNNPGRMKYRAKKAKLDAKIESYVNQEINRMLKEEKPGILYLPKLPKDRQAGNNKKINYSVGMWKKGMIRKRLEQKCLESSVTIVEVFGKAISTECSQCGAEGKTGEDKFVCASCGYQADKKVNAAQNAIKRGKEEKDH